MKQNPFMIKFKKEVNVIDQILRKYKIYIDYIFRDLRRIIKKRRINIIFRPLTGDFVYYGRDRFFRFLPELCIIRMFSKICQIL